MIIDKNPKINSFKIIKIFDNFNVEKISFYLISDYLSSNKSIFFKGLFHYFSIDDYGIYSYNSLDIRKKKIYKKLKNFGPSYYRISKGGIFYSTNEYNLHPNESDPPELLWSVYLPDEDRTIAFPVDSFLIYTHFNSEKIRFLGERYIVAARNMALSFHVYDTHTGTLHYYRDPDEDLYLNDSIKSFFYHLSRDPNMDVRTNMRIAKRQQPMWRINKVLPYDEKAFVMSTILNDTHRVYFVRIEPDSMWMQRTFLYQEYGEPSAYAENPNRSHMAYTRGVEVYKDNFLRFQTDSADNLYLEIMPINRIMGLTHDEHYVFIDPMYCQKCEFPRKDSRYFLLTNGSRLMEERFVKQLGIDPAKVVWIKGQYPEWMYNEPKEQALKHLFTGTPVVIPSEKRWQLGAEVLDLLRQYAGEEL
ncbi:hypothetical protein [Thermaurantimonas aggregans]|uniref:hypothetical protein n=1 Tax=Thermaurantimonas aggregans TaxID=2173829 RepID=UPI000F583546|nr:hypothetical protein [Thermaurantimonas aggregans]MCX8149158.1 hypothetical protein [Thermaurantimonas aggregans]